jgi:hypothetical protein
MQTHGFLERNGYKTSDNVREGEKVEEKVVAKRGEWRIYEVTRSAY